jgi:hypothetical protein
MKEVLSFENDPTEYCEYLTLALSNFMDNKVSKYEYKVDRTEEYFMKYGGGVSQLSYDSDLQPSSRNSTTSRAKKGRKPASTQSAPSKQLKFYLSNKRKLR